MVIRRWIRTDTLSCSNFIDMIYSDGCNAGIDEMVCRLAVQNDGFCMIVDSYDYSVMYGVGSENDQHDGLFACRECANITSDTPKKGFLIKPLQCDDIIEGFLIFKEKRAKISSEIFKLLSIVYGYSKLNKRIEYLSTDCDEDTGMRERNALVRSFNAGYIVVIHIKDDDLESNEKLQNQNYKMASFIEVKDILSKLFSEIYKLDMNSFAVIIPAEDTEIDAVVRDLLSAITIHIGICIGVSLAYVKYNEYINREILIDYALIDAKEADMNAMHMVNPEYYMMQYMQMNTNDDGMDPKNNEGGENDDCRGEEFEEYFREFFS